MVGFVVLAIVVVATAVGVVVARQPVHSALFLVGNIIGLAVFYLSLSAEFLAVAQVLVYAGAIMVLFLFVVTLLTAGKGDRELPESLRGQRWWGIGITAAIGLAVVIMVVLHPGPATSATVPGFGSIRLMGLILWRQDFPYLVAVALMLLTAALGVLVLNRPEPARTRRVEAVATPANEEARS